MGMINLSGRTPDELPEGAYDVRGWQVLTELDGEKVGTVDDMLLDELFEPRYLDVDLGIFRKHVLIPLSEAHADPADRVVWIDGLDSERLREVPEYDHHPERLTPEYERRLMEEYRHLARREGARTPRAEAPPATLVRLGDLQGHRVARGVTDPRGWKVVGGDGRTLGRVRELIVDSRALTTRYLDCEIEEAPLELEPLGRHILVPAERVRLARKQKRAMVDGLFTRDLKRYPVYQGLPLDPDTEERIHGAFTGAASGDGRAGKPALGTFFGVRPSADSGATAPARSRGRPATPEPSLEPALESSQGSPQEASHEPSQEPAPETVEEIRMAGGDRVRIRVTGDDIIIERHASKEPDDG